jgi:hypothetical protein
MNRRAWLLGVGLQFSFGVLSDRSFGLSNLIELRVKAQPVE